MIAPLDRSTSAEKDGQGLAAIDAGALYLTPEQVGGLVQVHPKTLTRWAKADPTFPVLRIAGTTRYPRERLLRWLRDREQGQRTRSPLHPAHKPASAKAIA